MIFAIFAFLSGAPVKAETVTVAVLGDSLVQGYGLPNDAGFVPQLQQWLNDQGLDVTLINAGVSGDTTAGGLSRVDWTLAPDVDALIVSLGGNDVLRGIDPAVAKANLDGILAAAIAKPVPVLLIGISVPDNFGPAYKDEFTAIYPGLADKYDIALYPNFFMALTELYDRAAVLADFFQADRIHPNVRGVSLIVNDLGPSVAGLIAGVDEK